jgi:hypothetical protein
MLLCATVKPLRVSLVEPVAYLFCSYTCRKIPVVVAVNLWKTATPRTMARPLRGLRKGKSQHERCATGRVTIFPLWNYIDAPVLGAYTSPMPQSRMNELFDLAEANDGLFTSKEARAKGIKDSVLVRLAQRGRLVRAARGVYRIAHYPPDKFAQYRAAVLWAQASHGPEQIALSHETALLIYGISDANPAKVHLTVPKRARLRREKPEWILIHRADLAPSDVSKHEGMPVTSAERTIIDVLTASHRADFARQAIIDACGEGFLNSEQAARLRQQINRYAHQASGGAG